MIDQCKSYGLIDYLHINLNIDKFNHIKQNIGCGNIYNEDDLRISIYYVPKNNLMKLHDHDNMKVLSYLI